MKEYNYGYSEDKDHESKRKNLSVDIQVNCCGWDKFSETSFAQRRAKGRTDYYLLYTLEGEIGIHLHQNDISQYKDFILRQGELIIIPEKVPHEIIYSKATYPQVYWLHFTGYDARNLYHDLFMDSNPLYVGLRTDLIHIFKSIIEEFQLKKKGYKQIIKHHFLLLTAYLRRYVHEKPDDIFMEKVCLYMHSNLHNITHVQNIADAFHLSSSRFIHRFTEHMGVSPMTYLIGLRMTQAEYLLTHTPLSIKEIAGQVGYKNPLYFSKVFKDHRKESPTTFRKKRLG